MSSSIREIKRRKQKKVLFHLGHPAHFHLFRHTITRLRDAGHAVHIVAKKKDVLTGLLEDAGLPYENILPEGKSPGRTGMVRDLFRRGRRLIAYASHHRPDLLIGTSADISYAGKWLGIPAVNVNEDDAAVIPLHAWLAYPWADSILSPEGTENGRWNRKTVFYPGYHELAYLHPDHFTPDLDIATRYLDPHSRFFILRLAALNAHHDHGIRGIDDELALKLAGKLTPHGRLLVTSERLLPAALEPHRITVHPAHIHHLLAYASLFIGDSQTMSAEAGVLGTPFLRFNDFVGRLGYLRELEERYQLGYGITPDRPDELLELAVQLAAKPSLQTYRERRHRMLSEKCNTADYIHDFILAFHAKSST